MIFFTSDLHLNHSNIISYTNRPYKNINEMNSALIENYRAKVKSTDQVYILGDFAFSEPEKWLRLLPGNKFLIKGNHDKFGTKYLQWGFAWIKDVFELKATQDTPSIWLSHYAHLVWPKRHFGAWHLFGHSHGKVEGVGLSTDVGVDKWNYAPVSLEELKNFFQKKIIRTEESFEGIKDD